MKKVSVYVILIGTAITRSSIIQNTLVNIGVIRCITREYISMLTGNDSGLER